MAPSPPASCVRSGYTYCVFQPHRLPKLEFGVRIELTWRVLQTLASATRPPEHKLEEEEGFEPSVHLDGVRRFSKPLPSASRSLFLISILIAIVYVSVNIQIGPA